VALIRLGTFKILQSVVPLLNLPDSVHASPHAPFSHPIRLQEGVVRPFHNKGQGLPESRKMLTDWLLFCRKYQVPLSRNDFKWIFPRCGNGLGGSCLLLAGLIGSKWLLSLI